MKTYTVKQIAEMLHTNEETVRRWIRTDRMKPVGEKSSKKEGFVVSEESLNEFVAKTPKYSSLVPLATGIGTIVSPIVGVASAVVVAGLELGLSISATAKENKISEKELKIALLREIDKNNQEIIQKRILIQNIETEIEELKKKNAQYEKYMAEGSNEVKENE